MKEGKKGRKPPGNGIDGEEGVRYHRSIRQTGWEGGREVMVQPKITMVGRTYGRLTVLEQAEPLKKDRQAWYCLLYTSGIHV